MRITFLVNHDLASLLALHYLIPYLDEHQVAVFYTRKETKPTAKPLIELSNFEAEQINSSFLLNFFQTIGATLLNDINGKDYRRFAQTKPDLVVCIRHMSILKSKAIGTPKLGVINLHSGLLPKYQGVMASFWALLNQEPNLGTTLHFIEDDTIDTGAIISRSITEANYQQSYLFNVLALYKGGCENIRQVIERLNIEKILNSKPQSGQANYFSYPTGEDISRCKVSLFNTSDSIEKFL